ncbi:hypothetical protein FNF31_07144 [Cafeteria roenbergensis]|nr:hypothetical protein FNF31_07144 [Cafeteria roenbergensis]
MDLVCGAYSRRICSSSGTMTAVDPSRMAKSDHKWSTGIALTPLSAVSGSETGRWGSGQQLNGPPTRPASGAAATPAAAVRVVQASCQRCGAVLATV